MSKSEAQWHVYIVQCADNTLYTGCTNNLTKRITKHNAGLGAKYTKVRLPVLLVYSQAVVSRSAALKREYEIKQLPRAKKLSLIAQQESMI